MKIKIKDVHKARMRCPFHINQGPCLGDKCMKWEWEVEPVLEVERPEGALGPCGGWYRNSKLYTNEKGVVCVKWYRKEDPDAIGYCGIK